MKRFHVSLSFVLVTAVIATVAITGLGIGMIAYRHSVKATHLLWDNLSKTIADLATEKTLSYFDAAPELLQLTGAFTKAPILSDPFKLFSYCVSALKVYEHFYWVYYASAEGDIASVVRRPDLSMQAQLSQILPHPQDPYHTTFEQNYVLEGNQWIFQGSLWDAYDPRNRPYWKTGLSHPAGGWTTPYKFIAPSHGSGITYVRPVYAEGRLQGMWMIDYDLKRIVESLRSLQLRDDSLIAIVTDEGVVIASTIENSDALILQAWKALGDVSSKSTKFELGPYLGYIQSFPQERSIPWNIVALVPKSLFFQPIIHEAWITVLICLSICLLCALSISFFLQFLSKKLRAVSTDMDRVGKFDLSNSLFKGSFISEVNLMTGALDRMKTGLRSFAKYVPIDLVSQLLQSGHPAEIGGEKRQITILFSDLANFTPLAETETSEELVHVLGDYLNEMSLLIKDQKGTVDKYIGDGIMAFWGAPTPSTSHAFDACKAALIMQEKAHILWKNFKNLHHGIELALRIGINTGSAIVGNFGSDERMNYSAIGDSVNLANRLEGLNKIYGTRILVSPDTAKEVEPFFLLRPVDRIVIKEGEEAVWIYELLGYRTEDLK